ncbi:Hypothetical predicted protein [Olea europaea subsp. europaea]|uniref:Uncharacterized protein n=1 Tax=Olea europaea subsp. europaea TaxID=158383 RepID=A0A8S0RX38_OLEEU|nr:Hypothetical predicted protein [Olea europaea subsp. europaea]
MITEATMRLTIKGLDTSNIEGKTTLKKEKWEKIPRQIMLQIIMPRLPSIFHRIHPKKSGLKVEKRFRQIKPGRHTNRRDQRPVPRDKQQKGPRLGVILWKGIPTLA